MSASADRNLLFGMLSVQLDYVRARQFMEAANQWMLDKSISLGAILVSKGFLSEADRKFLDTIVDKHVSRSGSAQKSLESLQSSSAEISALTLTNDFLSKLSPEEQQIFGESTVAYPAAGEASIIGERFSLLHELAKGGLGEVYIAKDRELDREVALKKILDDRGNTKDSHNRFVAEAKITGGLEHPGIVPVYGLGAFPNGSPFYVMKLIRGQSLHEAIYTQYAHEDRSKSSPYEQALRRLVRTVIDACYAVGYANSRGVIHRDIKPQNIMMGKYGETLVVDWGLAKVKGLDDATYLQSEPPMEDARLSDSAPTTLGSVLGTCAYMSPEQAFGQIDLIDRRSDVFSLGATLYAVITGRAPYKGESREQILAAAKSCQYPRPRDLNPRIAKPLEAICLKALSKDPVQRYGNAVELAEDLDSWIAGAPVEAYPERIVQRTMRLARKHQSAVVGSFVFLCVASVALLLSNWAVGQQRNVALIERDRANQASRKAIEERERAQRNSDVSTAILEQFVKTIVGDKWANVPNLDDERLAMYELALTRFRDLLNLSPSDSNLKKNVCQLYVRMADIHRHRGNDVEAERSSEAANQLAESLVEATSGDIEFLHLISDCSRNLAQIKNARLGAEKALPFAEKAKQIALKRSAADKRSSAQLSLALVVLQYSEVLRDVSNPAFALEEARTAAGIFEKVAPSKSRPYVQPIYHISSLNAQVNALIDLGQLDEAVKLGQASLDMALKNREQFQDIIDIKTVFAEASLSQSRVERLRNQLSTAIEHADTALKVIEDLCIIAPSNVNYRLLKADAYRSLSLISLARGDRSTALDSADKSQVALDSAFVDQPINPQTLASQLLTRAVACAALAGAVYAERFEKTKQLYESDLAALRSVNPSHPGIGQAEDLVRKIQ